MCRLTAIVVAAMVAVVAAAPAAAAAPEGDAGPEDAGAILQRFVDAWRGPQEMVLERAVTLGFWISGEGGGAYHVTFTPDGSAKLSDDVPESFDGGYRTDMDTLRRLDRGELNAMTAMGRAKWSDPAPMDPVLPGEGGLTPQVQALLLPLTFHFWNRDWPEVVPFDQSTSRFVHGGNATILYYDLGLRTGWYQLEPGMHINADPSDQTNPFPSLFVITKGSCAARLGAVEQSLHGGEAVLVPAGMTHELWTAEGQSAELIMIAFGDGA